MHITSRVFEDGIIVSWLMLTSATTTIHWWDELLHSSVVAQRLVDMDSSCVKCSMRSFGYCRFPLLCWTGVQLVVNMEVVVFHVDTGSFCCGAFQSCPSLIRQSLQTKGLSVGRVPLQSAFFMHPPEPSIIAISWI